MALNYSIAIKCIDEIGNNIGNAKIHAYFNKVNTSSSESKWNEALKRTSGNGKTSFNLGDGSFLTSEGKIDNGDTILITAWFTDNNDILIDDKGSLLPNTIERCVNFIHTVDVNASSYSEEITLLVVKSPICDITIPEVTLTGHNFTIVNNSTIIEGPFSANGRDDLYQEVHHYNQDIFLGREIKETIYDLQEDITTLPFIEDRTYAYIDAGDWNESVKVYNYLGYFCETIDAQHILYNKPSIAFDYTFTKLLDTNKHIGVGNDDIMTSIQESLTNFGDSWLQIQANFEWYITDTNQDTTDNSETHMMADEVFNFTKTFNTEGEKTLTLKINWFDGFTQQQEVLVKKPFLEVYNIDLDFSWSTAKNLLQNGIPTPLGDDDLVTITNLNRDIATQNYFSNTEWLNLTYTVTKKKNDTTDDSEIFTYVHGLDNYLSKPEFYIRFYHEVGDEVTIEEQITYWDGYKEVGKLLEQKLTTQNYSIVNDFHWNTLYYGLNKVVTSDTDLVTLFNDTVVYPQNNIDILTDFEYIVAKDRYTSYTDGTILDHTETFFSVVLDEEFNFNVRKEGVHNISLEINYYDGYRDVNNKISKDITAAVLVPTPDFYWTARAGVNTFVEGRDDLVTFSNTSILTDYYNDDKMILFTRNLAIDWYVNNQITLGNYTNITIIGGGTSLVAEARVEEFLYKDLLFEPTINYYSAKLEQNITINFYYNDGYFNRDISLLKKLETRPYIDLVPGAIYTPSVQNRAEAIIFKDNSISNEIRIIDTDWGLTDRYENNSMNVQNRGDNALKTWKNVLREQEKNTTVNSYETHILSQDIIRWDDGFKLKEFSNTYSITTSKYSIIPSFTYNQIFTTGPEIRFTNTTQEIDSAIQLYYNMLISDKDNSDIDTSVRYDTVVPIDEVEHVYTSVSNSPFEPDVANKEVTMQVIFDDGWNEEIGIYTEDILVKPNRISQSFITTPIRHIEDIETEDSIVTGNNPIEFVDTSSTLRTKQDGSIDTGFIKNVQYKMLDTCI